MLGNIFLEQNNIDTALQYFERDRIADRLSPGYRSILAFILASLKRYGEAKLETQRAALEDPSLLEGYRLVDLESGFPHPFYHEVEVNQEKNDTKTAGGIKDTLDHRALAQFGYWNESARLVDEAYAVCDDLYDGYAYIGSIQIAYARYGLAMQYYQADDKVGRFSPSQRLQYARLLAHFGKERMAEKEVERAYDEAPEVYNGYAFIGGEFRKRGQFDIAGGYFEKDNNLNRLSAAHRHIYADQLAREGCMEAAVKEVEKGYQDAPRLKNGFARIGNILRAKGQFEEAMMFYRRDFDEGRLSPYHQCIYAEVLSRLGSLDAATDALEKAYSSDPTVYDGFAKIGNVLRAKGQFEEAMMFYRRDFDEGRLSPYHRCTYAGLLSRSGNLEFAVSEVDKAYELDPVVNDGYARVGWNYYWSRRGYAEIADFIRRDKEAGRLSPGWIKNYSVALAAAGMSVVAVSVVEQEYEKCEFLRDGYSGIGWHLFTQLGEIGRPLDYLERDERAGRLSPAGMLKLAELLASQTNTDADMDYLYRRSMALVAKAYEMDNLLKDGYSAVARGLAFTGVAEDVAAIFGRDLENGRMSRRCFIEYIRYLAMVEIDLAVAEKIARAYRLCPEYSGGYAALAFELAKHGEFERAVSYCELDRSWGKMPSDFAVRYLQLLVLLKRKKEIKALLDVELVRPDAYRYQALAVARRNFPDVSWPVHTVPVLENDDVMQAGRILMAMAHSHTAVECIDFAQTLYKRRTDLMDYLCCGARSALSDGDVEKAAALYEEDRRLNRARTDSMLQYAGLLFAIGSNKAEKVLDEALSRYPFQVEPWLSKNHNRHAGKRCFIVGTGPSMNRIDCGLLSDEIVFAVNGAIFLEKLKPTYFVSVSKMFWRHHAEAIRELKCRRFLPYWMRGPLSSDSPTSWINAPVSRSADMAGQPMAKPFLFSTRADRFIALGGSVMFACLQLAWFMGFKEVVFLGLDHDYGRKIVPGNGGATLRSDRFSSVHFMQNYYKGGFFHLDLETMENAYQLGLDFFEKDGRCIINATPDTKLSVYPNIKFEEVIAGGG